MLIVVVELALREYCSLNGNAPALENSVAQCRGDMPFRLAEFPDWNSRFDVMGCVEPEISDEKNQPRRNCHMHRALHLADSERPLFRRCEPRDARVRMV